MGPHPNLNCFLIELKINLQKKKSGNKVPPKFGVSSFFWSCDYEKDSAQPLNKEVIGSNLSSLESMLIRWIYDITAIITCY